MRRKLNAEEKRARLAGDLHLLVARYGRKAQKNADPNDRRFDEDVLRKVDRMRPDDLDRLLRDDAEE